MLPFFVAITRFEYSLEKAIASFICAILVQFELCAGTRHAPSFLMEIHG
jgi:hypothetical protein